MIDVCHAGAGSEFGLASGDRWRLSAAGAAPKAMPVVLDPGDFEGWLAHEYASACALAKPHPDLGETLERAA